MSWTLPRLIGSARATALSLLAEPVTAEAALEMGLVNAVVEPERVLPAAHELAARLAAGPTAAYAAIKESLAYAASASLTDALAMEGELQAALWRDRGPPQRDGGIRREAEAGLPGAVAARRSPTRGSPHAGLSAGRNRAATPGGCHDH